MPFQHAVFPQKFILTLLCLCGGFCLHGQTAAQEQPRGHDLQIKQTLNQLLGEQNAVRYKSILSPEEPISWDVYLPNNDTDELPGVLVYISPTPAGRIHPGWRQVMDQQNMIYIGANESGNLEAVNRRMVLAVMAVRALAQRYAFAADRINIAGFSGGGRVASLVASQYPEVFTGALYICGVDFWEKKRTPNVEHVIGNRFVFLTGSRDFNQDETRTVYQKYIRAGAKHSKYMVVPGMRHQRPDAQSLDEALRFLNGTE